MGSPRFPRRFTLPWRGAREIRDEVDEELAFHLDMRTDALVREGMDRDAAHTRARREFGDLEEARRSMREADARTEGRRRRAEWLDELRQDVRFAVRALRRSPGFAAAAMLTLALGIGASTAMFSVLNGVLLQDLPVEDQDRIAVLWTAAPARSFDHLPVTHQELTAFRQSTRELRAVAGVAYQGALEQVLTDASRPVTVNATWVTGNLFSVLGVVPALGRTLLPSDDVPGAAPAMVIGYGFWQRHFGGDVAAVGRTFEMNGKRFSVVGVLPRGFEYPRGAEVWVPALPDFPATLEAKADPSQVIVYDLVGRLAPGSTTEAARDEFDAFLRAGDAQRPAALRGTKAVVTPLPELITGDARAALWTGAAAVGLLLLIACANVANLLLIRGSARAQELAIRSALGAARRRLVHQLLTESAVLALAGGALGIVLAATGVRLLAAFATPELPRREMIGIDARVLAFALTATAAAALLSGLLPALLAAAGELSVWLRGGHRSSPVNRGGRALRHGLVIGQVSLAILVVAGAGLLVRSLVVLQNVDLGFERERLLVLQTSFPPKLLPERPAQVALQEEMVARVAAIPGVTGAAALPRPPYSGEGGWSAMFTGQGQSAEAQAANPVVNLEVVGPGFFRTLQIPLRRGRAFGAQDREGAPGVAILSESAAKQAWPGEDPIGKQVKLGGPDSPGEWATVVGVVAETRYRELTSAQPTLYLPIRQFPGPVPMTLAVRTRSDPAGVLPQLRAVLRDIHPELAVAGGGSMRQLMAAPLARPRFSTWLLVTFAAATLLLAAVGLYGAIAATVRGRTREFGIRLALGARAEELRTLVVRQGLHLALWGCILGIAGALAGTRVLRSLLFEVSPTDPATFVVVVGVILATAALASYLPARRASRVDPVHALRAE
ncbi:MAG TPA: ABC transporter permease [Longimicrobium sp.]|jgi:predicted permease